MRNGKLISACLLLATGCAIQTHYYQDGVTKPETSVVPDSVKVYSGSVPTGMAYQVLGSIAVDRFGDGDAALELLREEASAMGADGVIEVRLTKMNSFAQRTGLSGVAIRTK